MTTSYSHVHVHSTKIPPRAGPRPPLQDGLSPAGFGFSLHTGANESRCSPEFDWTELNGASFLPVSTRSFGEEHLVSQDPS